MLIQIIDRWYNIGEYKEMRKIIHRISITRIRTGETNVQRARALVLSNKYYPRDERVKI